MEVDSQQMIAGSGDVNPVFSLSLYYSLALSKTSKLLSRSSYCLSHLFVSRSMELPVSLSSFYSFFFLSHTLCLSLCLPLYLSVRLLLISLSLSLSLSQLVSPSSPFPPSLLASLSTLSSLFWFSLSLSTYLSLSLPSVILIICMLAHAAPQATQNNVSRKRPQMARHITLPNFNRQGTSDGYKYG